MECVQYHKETKKSLSAISSNRNITSVFNPSEIVYVLADWHNPVVHYTLCAHHRRLDRCIKCIHPPAATHPRAIREANKAKKTQASKEGGGITVKELISSLRGDGGDCNFRPNYPVRVATSDGTFEILSVYSDDDKKTVWIDIKAK